jgi:hypothetical protein
VLCIRTHLDVEQAQKQLTHDESDVSRARDVDTQMLEFSFVVVGNQQWIPASV